MVKRSSSSNKSQAKKAKISPPVAFASSLLFLLFFLSNISSCFSQDSHASDPSSFKAIHGEKAPVETITRARVQGQAPKFSAEAVVNGEFKTIALDDFQGKYLVMFFYPLDFTFVCPTEITAFSDRAEEFRKLGCEIIAVSVDSKYTHLAWTNTPRAEGGLGSLKIPLVSDLTKDISKKYGVLLEEGPDSGVSLRGLFIINQHGVIRHISINDLPVGRNVDEVLRLVQAFLHTDVHGEVCPSGWKPGDLTMVDHPLKSKEYFRKVWSEEK